MNNFEIKRKQQLLSYIDQFFGVFFTSANLYLVLTPQAVNNWRELNFYSCLLFGLIVTLICHAPTIFKFVEFLQTKKPHILSRNQYIAHQITPIISSFSYLLFTQMVLMPYGDTDWASYKFYLCIAGALFGTYFINFGQIRTLRELSKKRAVLGC